MGRTSLKSAPQGQLSVDALCQPTITEFEGTIVHACQHRGATFDQIKLYD